MLGEIVDAFTVLVEAHLFEVQEARVAAELLDDLRELAPNLVFTARDVAHAAQMGLPKLM